MLNTTLQDLINDPYDRIVLDCYDGFVTYADSADGHCSFDYLELFPTLEEVRAQLTAGGYRMESEWTENGRTKELWVWHGELLEKPI